MGKNTLFFLLLALFAGAAGGIAAHLLVKTDSPAYTAADEPPPRDETDADAIRRAEIDSLREQIRTLRTQVSDLQAARVEAEARLAEAGKEPAAEAEPDEQVANLLESADVGKMIKSFPSPVVAVGGPGGPSVLRLPGLGRGAKLMGLPEDERWEKIREDLSLDAWQEDELRRLAQENREAMKKMFMPGDGEKVDISASIGKMMEQRKKSNERVKRLLSDDQYKKFNEGGYGAAMGLGATTMSISYTSGSMPKDEDGK